MPKLTAQQQQLLHAAAAAEDDMVDAPPVRDRALSGLIRQGMAVVVPGEDGARRLLITALGRQTFEAQKPAPRARKSRQTPIAQAAVSDAAQPDAPSSKLAHVVALLQRADGATLPELMSVTGWQAHSVRGAIAGAIKKKLGHEVTSEKVGDMRTYRIVGGQS